MARIPLVALVSLLIAVAADAAGTAPQMYADALAREQAARTALAGNSASAQADVRFVVAAYQEIVRRFPTSPYSDNALWQGGVLALDAYRAFGLERDRSTGLRLLRLLASEYPSSRLVKEIPAQLSAAAGRITPVGAALQGRPALATIKGIRREVLPDAVRITIELDREVPFHEERILGPVRVFVDLPSTRASTALLDRTLRFDGDNDLVRQIRIGRHPDNRTRVVLDATDVSSYSVYPMYDPYRLVIDCVRPLRPVPTSVNAARLLKPAAPPAANVARAPVLRPIVARAARVPALVVPAVVPAALPPPPVVPSVVASAAAPPPLPATATKLPAIAATTAPSRNADGGYSMARQLGLSVSRIVIDPGHGGHDPGAQGHSIDEAELVLDVALRVEKLLQKVPGINVILTRRTDDFVPLPERTAIANREGADLFLSIHANASANPSARGVETYFLNFASNMSAASVAARENAASGQAMGALPDFLKAIALNNKLAESRDLAAAVQNALVERLRRSNKSVKDLGVKQAPFVVLIGAAMPSVLAEISFLTNAQEAKLLDSGPYRQRIAEALAGAIQKYQTSLHNIARVER